MSLRKKITLSFSVSALVIAVLTVFTYINFIQIRKEIAALEAADTIRTKSLQTRRHEKNFLLYGSADEAKAVYGYLSELESIVDNLGTLEAEKQDVLKEQIGEYRRRFSKIEASYRLLGEELREVRAPEGKRRLLLLIELTFLEKPLEAAEFLVEDFAMPRDHRLVAGLVELASDINALRKDSENILSVSKEMDLAARRNAEKGIRASQLATWILFPFFLVVGVIVLLTTTNTIVRRLELLMRSAEETGKGRFSLIAGEGMKAGDEVDVLIGKFNFMERQLREREKELLESKKLAAIGTLASGVAHELNNPLNNIYTTAQRLMKKSGEECPPFVKKGLDDIFGQTMRVKKIVSDLLEFARGRAPRLALVEVAPLVEGAFRQISRGQAAEKVEFSVRCPEGLSLLADPEQMEEVFINLFQNAVEAMSGEGTITVAAEAHGGAVTITVSDTGKGISGDAAEKIFEPFYTTKDTGTGLGLSIVFNIVRKHGGDISVRSAAGGGAAFVMTFPAAKKE
ncbi:MAG: hypothetical protein Kow0025_15100 [Thermodesulfovibrionales bacterium]